MTHILVSAAHKSSGKTTIAVGLCAALAERGLAVQPFKKGPDYIDPMWLGTASGRPCRHLDYNTMSEAEIVAAFNRHCAPADIGIIEGNKGLYDGLDLEGSNSNAALSLLIGAPVVLVIDVRGTTRGIAPLLQGYRAFDPSVDIAGVILNKVGGSRHESKLRAVVEHFTDIPILGAVQRHSDLEIAERHLGLVPSNEAVEARAKIAQLGDSVARQVDLDRVLEAAGRAAPVVAPSYSPAARPTPDVRIAVARDSAFGFYYTSDLEALEAAGAELVPFNALRDSHLPDADGLFIGGGFPETHMAALEANEAMRTAVRDAIEGGMPAFAECGGLMYLARRLIWNGTSCSMVGVIDGDAVMHDRPQGKGYVRLRETGKGPWKPLMTGDTDTDIRAHEFHYSTLENLADGNVFAYEVVRGAGIDGRHDGLVHKNLVASYAHMRGVGGNCWPQRFVDFVRARRR
jgi:cobyrinic acid a,c-diamide synthase